jgi:hypothetical protein
VELFARTDTPNCRSTARYGLNRVKILERNETISGKSVGTAVRPYSCVAEHQSFVSGNNSFSTTAI